MGDRMPPKHFRILLCQKQAFDDQVGFKFDGKYQGFDKDRSLYRLLAACCNHGFRKLRTEGRIVKRAIVLGVMVVASFSLFVSPAPAQQGGKVLLIIRNAKLADPSVLEWTITKEAAVIKETLQKAGYQVDVASPTGQLWGTPPNVLKPDRKLSDVKVDDYKGFVIPCLAIDSDELHPDLAAVIKSAVKTGKPIAAQTGGVTLLAKAGVLSGKRYAITDTMVPEFREGIYSGSGVVKDGNIITSGICPVMAKTYKGMQDGTPKLLEALLAELKQAK